MSKHDGRHARSRENWDSQPSRSAERREAAAEPERTAPGRKDRRACCKRNSWGPHVPAIVAAHAYRPCAWGPHWSIKDRAFDSVTWRCWHEERCVHCGKVLRVAIRREECPVYPGDPAQRVVAEADAVRAQERQDAWRHRKRKVIIGPQGFRRQREKAPP
jgi:hypothetical protein